MTCKSYDIPKTLIWEAWLHVKANQGAAGCVSACKIDPLTRGIGVQK